MQYTVFVKIMFFKQAKKYLLYFWKKICCKELSDTTQSSHTDLNLGTNFLYQTEPIRAN